MRSIIPLAVLGAALAVAGCASLPHPAPEHEAWARERYPGVTLAELEADRELYVRRCSGCHYVPSPAEVRAGAASGMLEVMGQKARTSPEEQARIERFVEVMSAVPARPPR